jgi:hypothetical protein
MSAEKDTGAIESPCTSVCVIDPVTGLCAGCFRNLDEIAGWIDFSTERRRAVMEALARRRERFGADIAARYDADGHR